MFLLLGALFSSNIYNDFKLFLVNNGIFTLAGAIIIGLSTAYFIKEMVTDLLLPVLYLLLFKWIIVIKPTFEAYISTTYKYTTINFISFLQNFLIWIIALLSTFFILEIIFRRVILKNNNNNVEEENTNKVSSNITEILDKSRNLNNSMNLMPLDNLYGNLF